MKFRNLDNNGDWKFGKGKNDYVKESDAISLNIRTRILSWLNDCFFAMDEGIDWINRLGNMSQKVLLEEDLKNLIVKSEGVTGITEISTQLNGREFTATYNITTIYSENVSDTVILGV